MSIDQFTTEASDYAARVDQSVLFCSALSGRHRHPPGHRLIVVFLVALSPRLARAARRSAEASKHEIEIGWTVATLFTVPVHFLVGGVEISSPR